jgi:hypothetical protein
LLAGRTGEPASHCPAASPGGGDVCGNNCESYCALMGEFCPDDLVDNCEEKCAALYDDGTFDVKKHHDGDYMQCRLVHVSSAAVAPETHCWHSTITPGIDSPCADLAGTTPRCADYCRLVTTACQGDRAVYESEAQCLAVCAALDVGDAIHRVEDTVGCRRYHSYSSLEAPDPHCSHAGPGGDGHCGKTNCPAYCRLLESVCSTEFAATFGTPADCETACAAIPGSAADSGYSVATAGDGGGTLQCRLLYVSRAFTDAAACASAVGGGQCQ